MFCRAYKNEIDAGKARMNASRNGFVRQCCQQTIDQLTAEKRAIEAGYIEPSVDEQFGSGQPNRTIVALPLVQKDYPNDHHSHQILFRKVCIKHLQPSSNREGLQILSQ